MREVCELLEPGRLLGGALVRELLVPNDDTPAPGTRVGVFRVVRELGRGGMGVVMLAERDDGQFQQQVALKWLSQHAGALSEDLFRRERQLLAGLRHPHIARLVDGGQRENGQPWLAMELIEGENLDRHAVRHALPLRTRISLFLEVCGAVAYAHARGVLHRDIKPSNVMVDADGRAKLLDFGIAALVGADSGVPAAFTPGFASPEQRRGETPTVAADIYQLGRLLAALLARDTDELATVVAQDTTRDTAPPLPMHAPADLLRIIRDATALAPEARYPTVAALAADLQAFLDGRPIAARRREPVHVFARFVARHKLGTALLALGLAAIAVLAAWSVQRIASERDRADERARVTRAVLSFVEDDLLAAADPSALPGKEMTVRQALDRASEQVGARFANALPEQVALRNTLAQLYSALGVDDRAEEHARAALAAAQAAAPDEVDSLRLALADVLISRDQLDEATALVEATAVTDHTALSRDAMRSRLAFQRGDYAAAADALRPWFAAGATGKQQDAWAVQRYADALRMLGEHAEALALLDALLARAGDAMAKEQPLRLGMMHDRGILLRHLGRFDAAAAALSEVLASRRHVLGNSHPETLKTVNELATVYQEQRRFDLAEPLFREALSLREAAYGEAHHLTRNSMSNLGLLLSLAGRLDEAAVIYERTLDVETALIGVRHPDTLALMHNIAGLYRKQARFADALAMHERVLATAREVLGADAWQCGLFEVGQAQTLQAMGRIDAAAAAYANAEVVLAKSLGTDHPRTQRVRELRAALAAPP